MGLQDRVSLIPPMLHGCKLSAHLQSGAQKWVASMQKLMGTVRSQGLQDRARQADGLQQKLREATHAADLARQACKRALKGPTSAGEADDVIRQQQQEWDQMDVAQMTERLAAALKVPHLADSHNEVVGCVTTDCRCTAPRQGVLHILHTAFFCHTAIVNPEYC